MEVVGRKSCVPSAGSCCAFVLLRGVAASVCWCSAVLCCLSQTCGDVPRGWCRSGVSGRPQTRFPGARVHFTGAGIMQQPDRISHNSPQPSLKPHPSPILGDTSPRLAPFLYCSAADCAAPLFPFVLTLFLSLLCLFLDLPSAFYILSACEPYGLPVNTSPQPPPFGRIHRADCQRLDHQFAASSALIATIAHYAEPEKGEEGWVDA
jgi:hypothetical protein